MYNLRRFVCYDDSNIVLLVLDIGIQPELSKLESDNYCDLQISKSLIYNKISGDIKEIDPELDLNIGDNI